MCCPVLNLKLDLDLKRMRAIAEEAFALVREIQGLAFGRTRRRASCAPNFTR